MRLAGRWVNTIVRIEPEARGEARRQELRERAQNADGEEDASRSLPPTARNEG